jgi:hypothetical protein
MLTLVPGASETTPQENDVLSDVPTFAACPEIDYDYLLGSDLILTDRAAEWSVTEHHAFIIANANIRLILIVFYQGHGRAIALEGRGAIVAHRSEGRSLAGLETVLQHRIRHLRIFNRLSVSYLKIKLRREE